MVTQECATGTLMERQGSFLEELVFGWNGGKVEAGVLGRGNSVCKGPGAEDFMCLECSQGISGNVGGMLPC